jgi:hypothetical protein
MTTGLTTSAVTGTTTTPRNRPRSLEAEVVAMTMTHTIIALRSHPSRKPNTRRLLLLNSVPTVPPPLMVESRATLSRRHLQHPRPNRWLEAGQPRWISPTVCWLGTVRSQPRRPKHPLIRPSARKLMREISMRMTSVSARMKWKISNYQSRPLATKLMENRSSRVQHRREREMVSAVCTMILSCIFIC